MSKKNKKRIIIDLRPLSTDISDYFFSEMDVAILNQMSSDNEILKRALDLFCELEHTFFTINETLIDCLYKLKITSLESRHTAAEWRVLVREWETRPEWNKLDEELKDDILGTIDELDQCEKDLYPLVLIYREELAEIKEEMERSGIHPKDEKTDDNI